MTEPKDMLATIYTALLANETIAKLTLAGDGSHRISYFESPETADHDNLFVVITPVGPPVPAAVGSDDYLNVQFTFQVNVESISRQARNAVAREIQNEMLALVFSRLAGAQNELDEFMTETNRFVDVRRYRGNTKLYDTNY